MKIKLVYIAVCSLLLSLPMPITSALFYYTDGGNTTYRWEIDTDNGGGEDGGEINDVNIYPTYQDAVDGEDGINTDSYDGTGNPWIAGEDAENLDINGGVLAEDAVDGSYSYDFDNGAGITGTMTVSIQNNNVTYVLTSDSSELLEIYYNLGSDEDTTFVEINGRFFSYEAGGDAGPSNDPIILWETDGTIDYSEGEDSDYVSTNGTSLTLKHYMYAHINDNSLSTDEFFNLFAQWVAENTERMDVFTPSWRPAPALITVRRTTNLTFAESQFGSDLLSDPTGELRRIVDTINRNYP